MPAVRVEERPELCGSFLRTTGSLLAICTLALSLAAANPVQAQEPNNSANHTPLDDLANERVGDLRDEAIEFWFEHASLDPTFIELGRPAAFYDLEYAMRMRDFSAAGVEFSSDRFLGANANALEARAAVNDLESQLMRVRYALDSARYLASSHSVGGVEFHLNRILAASDRVLDLESQLARARSAVIRSTSHENYLRLQLASSELGLWRASAAVRSAQPGVFYFDEVAPRANSGIDLVAEHLQWFFVARDALDLATNPVYRVQTADAASRKIDFGFSVLSYFISDTPLGVPLLVLQGVDENANRFRAAYKAFEHQDESIDLAFSGTLSRLNLNALRSYSPAYEFYDHRGWFFQGAANSPLAVYGRWSSVDSITADRFDTQAWYRFKGLETASGHLMTGSGTVIRERIEQHDPFQFDALLNFVNFFHLIDSMTMTETTQRYESYNDSFNGDLVNQSLSRLGRTVTPGIPFRMPPLDLYDYETRKRKPDVFPFPQEPPRPVPNALGDPPDELKGKSAASSKKLPPPTPSLSAIGDRGRGDAAAAQAKRVPHQSSVPANSLGNVGGVNAEVKQPDNAYVSTTGTTKKQ